MTLRLYNTLTRTRRISSPLDPANVRMYVCGPTVYDFAHIGNARPAIVFDVLFRLLRHLYGDDHVTYVRNVTDVDDKINARAHDVAEAKCIPIEAAREEITGVTRETIRRRRRGAGLPQADARTARHRLHPPDDPDDRNR